MKTQIAGIFCFLAGILSVNLFASQDAVSAPGCPVGNVTGEDGNCRPRVLTDCEAGQVLGPGGCRDAVSDIECQQIGFAFLDPDTAACVHDCPDPAMERFDGFCAVPVTCTVNEQRNLEANVCECPEEFEYVNGECVLPLNADNDNPASINEEARKECWSRDQSVWGWFPNRNNGAGSCDRRTDTETDGEVVELIPPASWYSKRPGYDCDRGYVEVYVTYPADPLDPLGRQTEVECVQDEKVSEFMSLDWHESVEVSLTEPQPVKTVPVDIQNCEVVEEGGNCECPPGYLNAPDNKCFSHYETVPVESPLVRTPDSIQSPAEPVGNVVSELGVQSAGYAPADVQQITPSAENRLPEYAAPAALLGALAFSSLYPDYELGSSFNYSGENGNLDWEAGMRGDFHHGSFSSYVSAVQSDSGFEIESGTTYRADRFLASYTTVEAKDYMNYNVQLSSPWQHRGWEIKPNLSSQFHYDRDENHSNSSSEAGLDLEYRF